MHYLKFPAKVIALAAFAATVVYWLYVVVFPYLIMTAIMLGCDLGEWLRAHNF